MSRFSSGGTGAGLMRSLLVATSHSPLTNIPGQAAPEDEQAIQSAIAEQKKRILDFKPNLIIQFGDDHNSGMSLALMPPFMIGLRAKALGDFNTSSGPMLIDEQAGRLLARSLHAGGVDVATAYKLILDHGFVWALDRLLDGVNTVPVVPVFINCGGDMRPPLHRCLALGQAVGAAARAGFVGRRVLFLASGGLSHDPPLPNFETSPPEVQERMIEGTQWDADSLALRTDRVAAAGREHGAGDGDLQPLNPDWDRWVMAQLASGDLDALAALSDEEVVREGGRGGSEIRIWLAAFAAMQSANGGYAASTDFYRAVPNLIVGFGAMHAQAA